MKRRTFGITDLGLIYVKVIGKGWEGLKVGVYLEGIIHPESLQLLKQQRGKTVLLSGYFEERG